MSQLLFVWAGYRAWCTTSVLKWHLLLAFGIQWTNPVLWKIKNVSYGKGSHARVPCKRSQMGSIVLEAKITRLKAGRTHGAGWSRRIGRGYTSNKRQAIWNKTNWLDCHQTVLLRESALTMVTHQLIAVKVRLNVCQISGFNLTAALFSGCERFPFAFISHMLCCCTALCWLRF